MQNPYDHGRRLNFDDHVAGFVGVDSAVDFVSRLRSSGSLVTVIWKGQLGPGETLVINSGAAEIGALSRPLPAIPMGLKYLPPESLEIVEAPSDANN